MPRNRRAALVVKLTAATATMAMATAGLAVAGVDLPDPADDAFKRVGVELPNQTQGDVERAGQPAQRGRSESVLQVIRGTAPEMRGCEFGHRVAQAARGETLPEPAGDACARDDEREVVPHGKADRKGDGDAAAKAADPARTGTSKGLGRQQSERAKGQRTATPQQRRRFGQDTADRARRHGQEESSSQGSRPDGAGRPDSAAPPEATPKAAPEGVGRPESTPGALPKSAPAGPPAGGPGRRPVAPGLRPTLLPW